MLKIGDRVFFQTATGNRYEGIVLSFVDSVRVVVRFNHNDMDITMPSTYLKKIEDIKPKPPLISYWK